jgi:hypothetical protein
MMDRHRISPRLTPDFPSPFTFLIGTYPRQPRNRRTTNRGRSNPCRPPWHPGRIPSRQPL